MGSNIHGISCTANNYLKQAWNDIKNEYEKNQTYSITLFENTLVCFMRLYNELRRKVNEEDTPCLEYESLEKEFEEMQNDNDLSLFMRTLRTNDTQIYSGFQEVLHILYNMFKMLILLECPCRAEVQSLSQILKVIIGMALWNILKTLLRMMMFFLSIV